MWAKRAGIPSACVMIVTARPTAVCPNHHRDDQLHSARIPARYFQKLDNQLNSVAQSLSHRESPSREMVPNDASETEGKDREGRYPAGFGTSDTDV